MYDMRIGRFISEDPLKVRLTMNPLSVNLYTYVINNPLNFIDPSGLKKESNCQLLDVALDIAKIEFYMWKCWLSIKVWA